MGYDFGWRPYVPVAERRRQAEKEMKKMASAGKRAAPVVIEGRNITRTFWGQAWCQHLEKFSDFANRLPRGRTYVRNGSVIDLQVEAGRVKALVSGSQIYRVEIKIGKVQAGRWSSLTRECTGQIGSVMELLTGKLSKAVMEVITHRDKGLFPGPREIEMDCSCPDWATMCKHVAAVLYGVGARLDQQPELLFELRQVDGGDLLAQVGTRSPASRKQPPKSRLLDVASLGEVFGIELAGMPAEAPARAAAAPPPAVTRKPRRKHREPARPAAETVRKPRSGKRR